MTSLEIVRNAIGDIKKYGDDRFKGNGARKVYKLSHKHIDSASLQVYKDDVIVAPANYVLSADYGILTFNTAPANDSSVWVLYNFSAFTDTEVNAFISQYGVKIGAVKLIEALLADAARRFDYSTGLESMSPSQIFEHLKDLREIVLGSDDDLSSSGGVKVVDRVSGYSIDDNNPNYDEPYDSRFNSNYNRHINE